VTRAERKALRATRSTATNPDPDKPHSRPHADGGQQNGCKWDGSARVSGEITVKPPPDLLAEYKASQEDNTAHNNKTRFINWLTLGAVVIYAGVTIALWCTSRESAKAARDAVKTAQDTLRVEQTPYVIWEGNTITWGITQFPTTERVPPKNVPSVQIHFKNAGRGVALDVQTYACLLVATIDAPSTIESAFAVSRRQIQKRSREDLAPNTESALFRSVFLTSQCSPDATPSSSAVRTFTTSEWTAIQSETLFIHAIYGLVFKDPFGSEYETQGCFILHPGTGLLFGPGAIISLTNP
jgi:hypothetical protein